MRWMRLVVQPPKSGSGSRAERFLGDRRFEGPLSLTMEKRGAYARDQLTGPGTCATCFAGPCSCSEVLLKAHNFGRRRRGPGTLFRGDAKWLQYSKHRHGRWIRMR